MIGHIPNHRSTPEGRSSELMDCYKLNHRSRDAVACHLCYEAHLALRERFPRILVPDQMYGVPEEK